MQSHVVLYMLTQVKVDFQDSWICLLKKLYSLADAHIGLMIWNVNEVIFVETL